MRPVARARSRSGSKGETKCDWTTSGPPASALQKRAGAFRSGKGAVPQLTPADSSSRAKSGAGGA
jgi:hypothetical protein